MSKILVLQIIIIINCIQCVMLSNCPLLRSSNDKNGILIVNKTVMMRTGVPIHCQWLIASSYNQVSE